MEVTDQQRRLLALCAIRVDGVGVDWSLIARQAQDPSGLDDLYQAIIEEKSVAATRSRPVLSTGLRHLPALTERVAAELEAASGVGAKLITVLDRDYPANLRLIPNLPPFLFYRGELRKTMPAQLPSSAHDGQVKTGSTGPRRCRGCSPSRGSPWSPGWRKASTRPHIAPPWMQALGPSQYWAPESPGATPARTGTWPRRSRPAVPWCHSSDQPVHRADTPSHAAML